MNFLPVLTLNFSWTFKYDCLKELSTQNTTLACWNRHSSNVGTEHVFSPEKVSIITLGFFSFSLFYAHLIRDVTVGDLDLITAHKGGRNC